MEEVLSIFYLLRLLAVETPLARGFLHLAGRSGQNLAICMYRIDPLCGPLSEKSVALCRELIQILLYPGLMYRYPAATL